MRLKKGFLSVELVVIGGILLLFGILSATRGTEENVRTAVSMDKRIAKTFGSEVDDDAYGGMGGIEDKPIIIPKEKYDLTYDLNHVDSFAGGAYAETGIYVDWERDFRIIETVYLPKSSKRYLLMGNYTSKDMSALNIEVYNDNKLRVYLGCNQVHDKREGTVYSGEDIVITFAWNAKTNTYNITAKGEKTNVSFSGTYDMNGRSENPLRIGGKDARASTVFADITVKYVKLIVPTEEGSIIPTLPVATAIGSTLKGWYTYAAGGEKIENGHIMPSHDMTYYAQWQKDMYKVTLNYENDGLYNTGINSDTGTYINWNENFKLELTFNYTWQEELEPRWLLIGCYDQIDDRSMNIEVYFNKALRTYINKGHINNVSGVIKPDEDIKLTFEWDSAEGVYTTTLKGPTTDIVQSQTYLMTGGSRSSLVVGGADHRNDKSVFNPITIKDLKITYFKEYGTNMENPTRPGYTFAGWYSEPNGAGDKVEVFEFNRSKTFYAHWIEN